MASKPVLERVALQLRSEAAAIHQFLGLLRAEQQALVAGDLDALGPVVQQKDQALAVLLNFAAQRKAIFTALGGGESKEQEGPPFPPGAAGELLRREWDRLLALSAEAAELNRVNGQLINQRRSQCDQALAVLTASANRQAVYGSDGSSGRTSYSRSITAV